jgi:hypothetical protein
MPTFVNGALFYSFAYATLPDEIKKLNSSGKPITIGANG